MDRLSDNAIGIVDELYVKQLGYFSEYVPLKNALDALAAYEDTGLSPEEVRSIRTAYDENQVPYMIEATGSEAVHLFNLLQAEAEGRLIVLPCKMGGVIYRAINSRPIKGDKPWKYIKQSRLTWNNLQETLRDFGKTVFLTREEAEAALEGGKKDATDVR